MVPYLRKIRKELLESTGRAFNPGDLNYTLTLSVIEYVEENGLSYQTCNDIVGALDNCKDEFRRRIQHPYEDKKIEENGDVYDTIR